MDRISLVISGAVLALVLSLPAAAADPASEEQPKAPLEQASESVNKNLQKHPDNRGLQNASRRIAENQERIAAQRAAREQRRAERESRLGAERPLRGPERPGRGLGRR